MCVRTMVRVNDLVLRDSVRIAKNPFLKHVTKKPIICPSAPEVIDDKYNYEAAVVYRLDDDYFGERIEMSNIGIDIGTKTVVVAFKDKKDKVSFISEINGYWLFERSTPFVENMLDDPQKVRSDGAKRPARYFKEGDSLVILGRDAEEFAYAKNDTLLRPMAEGGISADDLAMTVLTALIHGMIGMAEKVVGKFTDPLKVCYCTTASAINKDNNIHYHEKAVDLILNSYNSDVKLEFNKIKESHAIVINMSPDGSGIGISWGAGTVTVSYVKYGMEIYSFCWVGAGDWIDNQVAMRHGYNPDAGKFKKKSKETPTTVAKRKQTIDLTPGLTQTDRLGLDIVLHYDVLISQVVDGIIQGFIENESEARIDDGIIVYMAGGTSSPKGFTERVKSKFEERELPFEIKDVKRSDNPLMTVAEGCLKASDLF